MSRQYLRMAVVLTVVALALAVAGAAIAAKGGTPGPPSGGGGGGGNKPPTEEGNSLSVPAIMVDNVFTGINAPPDGPAAVVPPTGDPSTGWEIDSSAFFYVQRENGPWQAQAYTYNTEAATHTGTAEWGDNLVGDAKLKVGSPIRVELGLFDDTGEAMDGYVVEKLQPSLLDRESAYGTQAVAGASEGTWQPNPTTFQWTSDETTSNPVRIYDSAVTLSIQNVESGAYVLQPGTPASAEINAKGAIVYGYNLRVSAAGDYEITYTIPNVDITGVDVGTFVTAPDGADTVTVIIKVIAGGGGGGGGH